MRFLLAIAAALWAGGAAAHSGHEHGWEPVWTWDAWIVLPLALSAAVYVAGLWRLWARAGFGRGIRHWQAACFAAGWLATAAAVVSPLHAMGDVLFSAHMIEHEILMAIAAPLFVLARPLGAAVWAMPSGWRSASGALGRSRWVFPVWRALTDPLGATVLHGAALWLWHAPAFFDAALVSEPLHRLQHASFFVTALCFWQATLGVRTRRAATGLALFSLFATALHTGFLGILITFAREPLYSYDGEALAGWGLSALEDQQLAGLVMWVPGGMVYAAAALVLAALWIERSGASAFGEDGAGRGSPSPRDLRSTARTTPVR